jgi:uncharacterized protein (TIGR00369 family)
MLFAPIRLLRHLLFMPRKTHVHGHVAHKHPLLKAALKKHPSLRKNFCFGCGKDNPEGMRLRFHHDQDANTFIAHFRLGKKFTGPPRHAHGGVIAAVLDEAMSKPSKPLGIMAPTIELTVNYLRPVPLGQKLTAIGWEVRKKGREHLRAAEIRNEAGEVLSAGRGTFLEIHAEGMMNKFFRSRKKSE